MRKSVLAAVRRMPAAQPALDDSVRRMSCGDLNQMVEQERRWLDSFVVRDCALVAENSCGWIISDLALLASDAVNVAIPTHFTPEQISHALHDSGVEFVLTEGRTRGCAEHAGFTKVGLSNRTGLTLLHRRGHATHPSFDIAQDRCWQGVVKASYRAHGLATPQAVTLQASAIEHAAEQLLQAQEQLGIGKHLCFLPLASVLENIGGVYVPLLLGAQVVLKTRAVAAMSCTPTGIETLLEALRQERPHSVALTAELLAAVVNALDRGWRMPEQLRSVVVGDGLSRELLQRARTLALPITQWDPHERLAPTPRAAIPARPFGAKGAEAARWAAS